MELIEDQASASWPDAGNLTHQRAAWADKFGQLLIKEMRTLRHISYLGTIQSVIAKMEERHQGGDSQKCPCCGHTGPMWSHGDHWDGCPLLDMILAAHDKEDQVMELVSSLTVARDAIDKALKLVGRLRPEVVL